MKQWPVRGNITITMGQYYIAAFIAHSANLKDIKKEDIIAWKPPGNFHNGNKLVEHSYITNNFMAAVEHSISPMGMFHKCRIIWAGDYADPEPCGQNIHALAREQLNKIDSVQQGEVSYRFIVNHTKKLYIDKHILEGNGNYILHPLSLLTADGNGRGGGDYAGTGEDMCGTWRLDSISMENSIPKDYTEFIVNFNHQ